MEIKTDGVSWIDPTYMFVLIIIRPPFFVAKICFDKLTQNRKNVLN